MKSKDKFMLAVLLGLLAALNHQPSTCLAQGKAFTYQGRLDSGGSPANGIFDVQFAIFDSANGGALLAGPLTNTTTAVSNGLLTVTLDFGAGVFTGNPRWLEIAVKPSGVPTNYTVLSPRQPITATPYAIRAASASSAIIAQGVSGPVAASQITGTISTTNLPPINNGASPLAPGGIVLSDDPSNAALAAQGFARMPGAEMTISAEHWEQKNPPADKTEFILNHNPGFFLDEFAVVASVSTGTELIVFRRGVYVNEAQEYRDDILIYNAASRHWRRATWLPAGTLAPECAAVWAENQVLLWGGRVAREDDNADSGFVYEFPAKVITYSPLSNQWSESNGTGAVPRGRSGHSAVWTGTQMLVWGGSYVEYQRTSLGWGDYVLDGSLHFATNGAAFDPATGQWTAISTVGAPSPRYGFAMVWTGSRMIVQGGTTNNNWVEHVSGYGRWVENATANDLVNSGFSYNPTTDTWSPIRSDGTAARHAYGQAVWTGREMFVYGGNEPGWFPYFTGFGPFDVRPASGQGAWLLTSSRSAWSYNPTNDLWTSRGVSDAGGPTWGGRRDFAMVWSGSEAIVYGGLGFNDTNFSFYARTDVQAYNMTNGTWRTLPAPPQDGSPTAIGWLGDQMVIYDSRTISYSAVSNAWTIGPNYLGPPPLNPIDPSVVWTGKELILWGGLNSGVPSNRGRRFSPTTGLWTEISTTNAPAARTRHSAVWTGTRMVVWGGDGGGDPLYPAVVHSSGGAYDPVTDTWTSLSATPMDPNTGSTFARTGHKAVWTAAGMVVVGGSDGYNNQGQNFPRTIARLSPNLASWTLATSVPGTVARYYHCLGTDGNRTVLLWGGQDQVDSDPIGNGTFLIDANTLAVSKVEDVDQPEPARNPTVVWSGKEYIVWGGTGPGGAPLGGGAKFNPDPALGQVWTPVSGGGPVLTTAHAGHTTAWSGTEMLLCGGSTNTFGIRYNPRNDAWIPMAVGPVMRAGGKSMWTGTNLLLYLPALPTQGAIPELWQYQPPAKTYLYLKL